MSGRLFQALIGAACLLLAVTGLQAGKAYLLSDDAQLRSDSAHYQQDHAYLGVTPGIERAQSTYYRHSGMVVQTGDTAVVVPTASDSWTLYH